MTPSACIGDICIDGTGNYEIKDIPWAASNITSLILFRYG